MTVQSLPPELIAKVLKHATKTRKVDDDSYFDNLSNVAAVCKTWLDTIKSEPSFWSYIYLDDYSSMDLLSASLKRSGVLPLTIHINLLDFYVLHRHGRQAPDRPTTVTDILSVLGSHIHRCVDLTLCARDEKAALALTEGFRLMHMPLLSHVDLDIVRSQDALPLLLFSATPPPGLHHFRFNGHFINATVGLLSGIQRLYLDSLYAPFSHLRRALENMPQLAHLHLLNIRCNVLTQDSACQLSTVTTLDVQLWGESEIQVLRLLRTPNLLRFCLRTDNASDLIGVVYDCVAEFKKLSHLTLYCTLASHDVVRDLLGFLPVLTHLNVMGCPSYTYYLFTRFLLANASSTSIRHCALPGHVAAGIIGDVLEKLRRHHTEFFFFYVDGADDSLVQHCVAYGRVSSRRIGWNVDFFDSE